MTRSLDIQTLIDALDLPACSRVDQRVAKKLLLEHVAPTAADKRQINEGIEELLWVATLKPTTIGVPEYRDEIREYLEIVILDLRLRDRAKMVRLVELVHRAVPYPVLLLTEQNFHIYLSVAHKRWAQNEAGKTVLDGEVLAVDWNEKLDGIYWPEFRATLALGRQPTTTLHALYQGWFDSLLALLAARITGELQSVNHSQNAADRHEALNEYYRLGGAINQLRVVATKEKQIARQVELNLEIKRLEAAQAAVREKL